MKIVSTLLLTATIGFTSAHLCAEKPPGNRKQQHFERLSSELQLTADQEVQVRKLMEEQHAAMMALRKQTHDKMAAILTAEQLAHFDELRSRKKEGRSNLRQGITP
jgi:Spy/CpxP family protein refolding chaperone